MTAGSRGFNWLVPTGRPKFLLIDDSSHNGGAMTRARTILREHDVTFAAVYTLTPHTVDVDAYSGKPVLCPSAKKFFFRGE